MFSLVGLAPALPMLRAFPQASEIYVFHRAFLSFTDRLMTDLHSQHGDVVTLINTPSKGPTMFLYVARPLRSLTDPHDKSGKSVRSKSSVPFSREKKFTPRAVTDW
jgi:hypothetical protein